MKIGGTTKIFVLLEQSNRTFLLQEKQNLVLVLKGGTIMIKLNLLIPYKALTQVIVPAFSFGFFPTGK